MCTKLRIEKNSIDNALHVWDAVGPSSSGAWDGRQPRSAYLHIPFCAHRCGYCNFSVISGRNDLMDAYVGALEKELSALQVPREVDTIFVGGGTPTHLSHDSLKEFLSIVNQWLPHSENAEWTFEANPTDLSAELCQELANGGVNRLSIGVQSFDDTKLKQLDRNHSADSARKGIEIALDHFSNVSIDLIFAAPGETHQTWVNDLKTAIALGLPHISTYGLTIEKGTLFWSRERKSQLIKPSESAELAMYETAIDQLASSGIEHYEVSNFAKRGFECKHNMAYWNLAGWWAFGCSAARAIGSTRSTNHASVVKYIHSITNNILPISDQTSLSHYDWTIDRFVFGMRTRRGVDLAYIKSVGDPEAVSKINDSIGFCLQNGMLQKCDSTVQLTRRGLVVSDSIWPYFYSD